MANFDAFTDGATALDQAHLDGLVPAQMSYLVSGGIASAATGLAITQPATVVVINDGTQAKRVAVASTAVNCGAGGVAQDNYVDLAIGGTYTVTTVTAGGAAPSVAANALRLYIATTNAGNTAVVTYTDKANRSPVGAAQPLGVATLDANGSLVQAPPARAGGNVYVSGATGIRLTTGTDGLVNSWDELDYQGHNFATVLTAAGGRRIFGTCTVHVPNMTQPMSFDLAITAGSGVGGTSVTGKTRLGAYSAYALGVSRAGQDGLYTFSWLTASPVSAGTWRIAPWGNIAAAIGAGTYLDVAQLAAYEV